MGQGSAPVAHSRRAGINRGRDSMTNDEMVDPTRTPSTRRGWRWRLRALTALAAVAAAASAAPARAQCFEDVDLNDDEPGQKDLSQFCLVGACGGGTTVNWSFDDTKWSGNNTGDACALFDTDNNGNADRAVCVTIIAPATMQANNPKCYTCGDDRPDRCTGAASVACGSTCSVASADDPFETAPSHTGNKCSESKNCPAGADCCRELDTETSCCLTGADSGGGVLIDVCSYPSQNPNSDPSDCISTRECSKTNPNDPACNDGNPCTADSCDP